MSGQPGVRCRAVCHSLPYFRTTEAGHSCRRVVDLSPPAIEQRTVGGATQDIPDDGTIGVQAFSWQEFFLDPSQWWDTKEQNEKTTQHLVSTRLNVNPQLNLWDAKVWPSWSGCSSLRELCGDGNLTKAVDLLHLLVEQGCLIPNILLYTVIKRCIAEKDLVLGKRIHAVASKSGYEGNAFLATQLIGLYASHGSLVDAMRVFSRVRSPSRFNWAAIISACVRNGEARQAIELYQEMLESAVKPDNRLYVAVLKACAIEGDLATGKGIHARVLATTGKPDVFVQTCLVQMYAKCGNLKDARKVFEKIDKKDGVTWTAMIAGYAHQGMGEEALTLYGRMQDEVGNKPPDSVTFVCLLQACACVGVAALSQGRQLYARIKEQGLQHDMGVGAGLINMYVKCGSLEDGRRLFDGLHHKSVVAWTAMIAGYAQQGMGQEALQLYSSMLEDGMTPPNSVTFVCLLQACASLGSCALKQGKQLHDHIVTRGLQDDMIVGCSLINMYVKCGSIGDAQAVFDSLQQKDAVTWTAMMAGYAQEGMVGKSLSIFSAMKQEGMAPTDSVTYVCLLQACSSVAALPVGKQLHEQITQHGLQTDVNLGSSLVNMYSRCGCMVDAQQVFDSLPRREAAAWGALIAGYARQGDSEAVFGSLERMRSEGIQPDGITFLSVLTVCSHVGLVDKGRHYFQAMSSDHGLIPSMDHFTCMVYLLGRAGYLEEALQMIKTMPFQPDGAVWTTMLSACQKWSNVEVGRQAFEAAVSLDRKDSAAYLLMTNIYAGAEMWEEAKEIEARRKRSGAFKQRGESWTDFSDVVPRD